MTDFHDDDVATFFAEMGDVKPLPSNDKVLLRHESDTAAKQRKREALAAELNKQLNPLTNEGVKPVLPDDYLQYKQPGIQDGVYKNLRLGKYAIEYKINLAQYSVNEARQQLYLSIEQSHEKGHRAILIQHGKGENSKPFPALKKSYVKHWLLQMDSVIAFHTAQPKHGGLGATYVLLKKHANQKMMNREKQRYG